MNHHRKLHAPVPGANAEEPPRPVHDSGQATAEYALVLLGAAAIALVLLAWATGGGGSHISGFFDHIFRSITDRAR